MMTKPRLMVALDNLLPPAGTGALYDTRASYRPRCWREKSAWIESPEAAGRGSLDHVAEFNAFGATIVPATIASAGRATNNEQHR
jgi:hypothetical protein